MKISVVVPTFKRPQLLLRCIDALSQQSFSQDDYEIIIVSDGPDPETQRLMAERKKRAPMVRFLSLPVKGGPAAARNFGWKASCGELIVFTDDDCIADCNWLEEFWNGFVRQPGNEIAFTGKTIVPISSPPTDYERNIANLSQAEFITANCACTPRALKIVDGFDEAFTMAWREDSDLQFKFIVREIPIIKVNSAIVTHPVRRAPWGVSIKEEKKGMFNALLYKKYPALYKSRIQPSIPVHYYIVVFSMLSFLAGIVYGNETISMGSLFVWIAVTLWFTAKRLKNTVRTWSHVSEMFVTSLIIPFLSIFYRIYGAVKFRSALIP